MSVFRPELTATNGLAFQGAQIDNLYPAVLQEHQPARRLSYAVDSKTVLRAGYGWYADTPNLNPFLDNRPGNQAPNGVEGNPGGPNPVYTVGAAAGGANTTIQRASPSSPPPSGYPCTASLALRRLLRRTATSAPPTTRTTTSTWSAPSARNVIAQLGYVGSIGRHLLSLLDINQAKPGVYANDRLAQQAARPYFSQYPQYGNINQISSIGTSNYNSLQAQLRINNLHHLTTQHRLHLVAQPRRGLRITAARSPRTAATSRATTATRTSTPATTSSAFVSYEVPGSQHTASRSPAAGRSTACSTSTAASPSPSSPPATSAAPTKATTAPTSRAVRPASRARSPTPPGSISAPSPTPLRAPSAPRAATSFYGPGYSDVDLSVFKNTKISERLTVQFRAEMFNLFNRINFAPTAPASARRQLHPQRHHRRLQRRPGIGAGEPFNTQFGAKIIF